MAGVAQDVGHRLAGLAMIVDHQHAAGWQLGIGCVRRWTHVMFREFGAHAAASSARLGNSNGERGPAFGAIGHDDLAAVDFGNAIDDGQPQAGAVALGGEERLEGPAADFVGQARAAVGNFDFEAVAAGSRRERSARRRRAWRPWR